MIMLLLGIGIGTFFGMMLMGVMVSTKKRDELRDQVSEY
jgi:hypothetical protein